MAYRSTNGSSIFLIAVRIIRGSLGNLLPCTGLRNPDLTSPLCSHSFPAIAAPADETALRPGQKPRLSARRLDGSVVTAVPAVSSAVCLKGRLTLTRQELLFPTWEETARAEEASVCSHYGDVMLNCHYGTHLSRKTFLSDGGKVTLSETGQTFWVYSKSTTAHVRRKINQVNSHIIPVFSSFVCMWKQLRLFISEFVRRLNIVLCKACCA